MDLAWIEAFLAVADTGSFSMAAETLFLSQSVVSKQVQKLEKALDTPLLDRGSRRVILTGAGKRIYPEATALLAHYQKLRQAANPGGTLQLALLPVADCYGLPRLLADFAAENTNIRLQVEERSNTDAHQALQADHCDGAFYRIPPGQHPPARHILLAREELVLLVPAQKQPAGAARCSLADFARENFLLLGSGTGLRTASLELCRSAGFTPRVIYNGSSGQNIARMVRDGSGVALLAEGVARALCGQALQILHLDPVCESLLIFAPSRAGLQNPAMAALWQTLSQQYCADPDL